MCLNGMYNIKQDRTDPIAVSGTVSGMMTATRRHAPWLNPTPPARVQPGYSGGFLVITRGFTLFETLSIKHIIIPPLKERPRGRHCKVSLAIIVMVLTWFLFLGCSRMSSEVMKAK